MEVYYKRFATIIDALAQIRSPVLAIFGGNNKSISVASVNQFDAYLDTFCVPNEIYIYPCVGHAFVNLSGMNYAPKGVRDAWDKTVAFLRKHL